MNQYPIDDARLHRIRDEIRSFMDDLATREALPITTVTGIVASVLNGMAKRRWQAKRFPVLVPPTVPEQHAEKTPPQNLGLSDDDVAAIRRRFAVTGNLVLLASEYDLEITAAAGICGVTL